MTKTIRYTLISLRDVFVSFGLFIAPGVWCLERRIDGSTPIRQKL
jgi:hypothetical protein